MSRNTQGLTPGVAIRRFCRKCAGSAFETDDCRGDQLDPSYGQHGVCFFFPYRQGRGRPSVKLIRKMCLECQGGSSDGVRDCRNKACAIFRYRFGTNPAVKVTPEKRKHLQAIGKKRLEKKRSLVEKRGLYVQSAPQNRS
jgi:hypothetical protein